MEMKVFIKRVDNDLQFEVRNENGNSAMTDGGAEKKGMRPMELLLSALGTCSAFDAVHILRKQRQDVQSFDVEVRGNRPDEGEPKPFTEIHAHFRLSGQLEPEKVNRAVALSMEKYCSVSATLSDDVKITHSVEIF
jgi:putative redox protein